MLADFNIDTPTTAFAALDAYERIYFHRDRVDAMRETGELANHAELLRIELAIDELDALWPALYTTHLNNKELNDKLNTMSHFYALEDNNVRFLPDVHTPAQAKKTPGIVCSSVTTKLGIAPNPFLDNWGKEQLVKLGRKHPDMHFEHIKQLMYGTRIDVDGKEVSSSQFGTSVHLALENALNLQVTGVYSPDSSPYSKYVNPFLSWFADEGMEIVATEQMVGDEKRLVAGTIDVVAKTALGHITLLDFKTRDCKGKSPREKTYEKDLLQLAVEADIVRNIHGLDYTPRIASVVIDISTGDTAIKWWTIKAQAKGEILFDAINDFYNAFILRV